MLHIHHACSNTYICRFFLSRFRDPIRVPRISNRVPRITENYHWVPKIGENWVPRIREIGSLQIHIEYLTFLKKSLYIRIFDFGFDIIEVHEDLLVIVRRSSKAHGCFPSAQDLDSCCKSEVSEIRDALEVMLSVPRRANDALHLSMMRGFDEDIHAQGEIIMQDSFQVGVTTTTFCST